MVVAARVYRDEAAYRVGHRIGNRLLTSSSPTCSAVLHRYRVGHRVFSRRFVKSFPVLSGGFEIETELTATHSN